MTINPSQHSAGRAHMLCKGMNDASEDYTGKGFLMYSAMSNARHLCDIPSLPVQTWPPMTASASCPTPTTSNSLPEDRR